MTLQASPRPWPPLNRSAVIPPSAIPPPLRSSHPAVDINGFFDVVGQALTGYIKTEGAPEGTSPIYIEDFPKERLQKEDTPFDVITFHVLDAQMGEIRNDGTVNRAPALREERPMKDVAGYNMATYGWWENNTVLFEVWSKTNSTANQLGIWFHRFMMRYANYYKFFEAYGVRQFKFLKRLEDTTDTQANQELYLRRFTYTFRLEYLDHFQARQLTELTLDVSTDRRNGEVQTIEIPPATN